MKLRFLEKAVSIAYSRTYLPDLFAFLCSLPWGLAKYTRICFFYDTKEYDDFIMCAKLYSVFSFQAKRQEIVKTFYYSI